MQINDWSFDDFQIAFLSGESEILIDNKQDLALMVYPWSACESCKTRAARVVQSMGYTDILETGHLENYTIEGADTNDCDYFLLAPPPRVVIIRA